jgi:hypothetical protein
MESSPFTDRAALVGEARPGSAGPQALYCGRTNALNIERLWRNVPVQLAQAQDGTASKFRFKKGFALSP